MSEEHPPSRKRLFDVVVQGSNGKDDESSSDSTPRIKTPLLKDKESEESSSSSSSSSSSEEDWDSEEVLHYTPHRCLSESETAWWSAWEMRGRRSTMEDKQLFIENVGGESELTLFAIFDGHGGDAAAQTVVARFQSVFDPLYTAYVSSKKKPTLDEFKSVMTFTFAELHRVVVQDLSLSAGCTALVALVTADRFFIASLGDSRAVVFFNDGGVSILTTDHVASNESEAKAVTSRGSFVFDGRVDGRLLVTRAIGDRHYAKGMSRIPDVFERPKDCVKFLLLSCDGVWEAMNAEHVAKLCVPEKTLHDTAQSIMTEAFERGSTDNISLNLIRFD